VRFTLRLLYIRGRRGGSLKVRAFLEAVAKRKFRAPAENRNLVFQTVAGHPVTEPYRLMPLFLRSMLSIFRVLLIRLICSSQL